MAPTGAGRAAVGVEKRLVQHLKRDVAEAALQDGVGAVVEGRRQPLRGAPALVENGVCITMSFVQVGRHIFLC
jgi:hypothetical protein